MPSADALQIAQDFIDLANCATDILSSAAVLTAAQTTALNDANTKLTARASAIAIDTALAALHAGQSDFATIRASTTKANAAATALKANAASLNKVLSILGAAVTLGVAFASGPLSAVLTAAGTLDTAAS